MAALGEQRIGFIGGGNMAEALIRGLVAAGVEPAAVRAADPTAERRTALANRHGIACFEDNAEVAAWASLVVLAVKPRHADAALGSIAGVAGGDKLLVSVAAGLRTATIDARLPAARLVRAMPNTPALIGQGATALARGPRASDDDLELARRLFDAVGRTVVVGEASLDAVTGLSGSGPAYVMLFIEALADGGVRAGLTREVALTLAAETVRGAAALQLATGDHPAALRDRVTSPGGTTAAGLAVLERLAVRAAVGDAVVAATERSVELGGGPAT